MGELAKWRAEKWVRIGTDGSIKGECGTSKNKKNPDRCLPLAKAKSMSKAEREKTEEKKKDIFKDQIKADTEHNFRILYIEDNPSNLRLMSQLLKQRPQIRWIDALEPGAGIKLALKEKPDLILLDINLPGMNGYEVIEQLKKHKDTNNIPVIAVSANAMPQDIAKGTAAGFDDYITKPINTTTLLETIYTYLKK